MAGAPGVLEPGQSVVATATYVLTQADVDLGTVTNTASVVGTDPNNNTPTANADASVAVPAAPQISLTKTPTVPAGAGVGDTVSYAFTATNTGNVTLREVAITDPCPDCPASRTVRGRRRRGFFALASPSQRRRPTS